MFKSACSQSPDVSVMSVENWTHLLARRRWQPAARSEKPIGIESKTSEIFSQLNYAKEKTVQFIYRCFYYRYFSFILRARGLNDGDKILARKAIYIQDNQ